MKKETQQKTRTSRAMPLAIIAALLLVICGLALGVMLKMRADQVTIPVTENVTLKLVDVLTREDPDFSPTPRRAAIYSKVPSFLKPLYEKLFPAPSPSPISYSTPGDSGVRLIFQPVLPPGAEFAGFKVHEEVASHQMRLNYGRGWYSHTESLDPRGYSGDPAGAVYVDPYFDGIPKTIRQLKLELLNASIEEQGVVSSAVIRNPVYEALSPLSNPKPLPATATQNGVSVTLHALVSKSTPIHLGRNDRSGSSTLDLAKELHFLRAAGNAEDEYYCAAAFSIRDPDSIVPQWTLKDTKFFYGQSLEVLKRRMTGGPVSVSRSNGSKLHLFSFQPDVGMLQQPVKVHVTAVRDEAFPPDEIGTIEIAIPGSKAVTGPVPLRGFWNGPVVVFVGKEAIIRLKNHIAGGRPRTFTVGLEGSSPYTKIVDVRLISEKAQLSATKLGGLSSSSGNSKGYVYDLKSGQRFSAIGPVDFDDFTTISLTIASPRFIEPPFEFITEPVEAKIPATPPPY